MGHAETAESAEKIKIIEIHPPRSPRLRLSYLPLRFTPHFVFRPPLRDFPKTKHLPTPVLSTRRGSPAASLLHSASWANRARTSIFSAPSVFPTHALAGASSSCAMSHSAPDQASTHRNRPTPPPSIRPAHQSPPPRSLPDLPPGPTRLPPDQDVCRRV